MPILRLAAILAVLVGIFMGLAYAPPIVDEAGNDLGPAFRIFYFHVPAAWASLFLCIPVGAVGSAAYLATRSLAWDRVGRAGFETAWVFATTVLVSGPIWARAAWGTYWSWEPRLTAFLVLWLILLAGLVLRGAVDEPVRRARLGAVFGILAALNVPIVYFAVNLWGRVVHPAPGPGFFGDPAIRQALLANVASFTLVAVYLMARRYRLGVVEDRAATAASEVPVAALGVRPVEAVR